MAEITVIVPVYQAEKYLERCLDSILEQTWRDFELLLIDDGSTDGSSRICKDYAKRDDRIRYIRKENGGVSSARNAGLCHATGEYLMFVDSDDYVESDILEYLYGLLEREQADMAVCRHFNCFMGQKTQKDGPIREFTADAEEGVRLILEGNQFYAVPMTKLYRKSLFQNLRYPDYAVAEDAYMIFPLLSACRKIVFSTAQKYYYMHREGSLSHCAFRTEDLDAIKVWTHNLEMIRKQYPRLERQAMVRYCLSYFYVLDKLVKMKGKQYRRLWREMVKELRKYPLIILRGDSFGKGRKLAYLVLYVSPHLYRLIVEHHDKKKQLFA